jgi:hypothetical protein
MPSRRRPFRSLVTFLLTAAAVTSLSGAAACSSSDGSPGPQPAGSSSSITLVVNPTGATIQQGSVGPFGVSVGRTNYTGNVDITLTGLPAGVTSTAISTQTTPGVTVILYQLNVASTTAVGTYPVTVRASGSGVTDATGSYTLVVSAAPAGASYVLSVAPTAYTAAPGGTASAVVSLARTNFTGSVNLSITGAPAGVTATFAPQNTTASTSAMTLNVASNVAPGTYAFSVGGVAAGQPDRIVIVTLTVPAAGSYTLASVPASVTLAQGASTTGSINVSRSGGFAGAVAIAVTGLPSGMTATVTPTATTTNAATLAISAGAATPVGTYTLTLTGTTSGLAAVTTTMQVTVTAGGTGGSGNVVYNFSACPAANKPIWLAFQDGNGAWTRVSGSGDVYTFNLAGTRGGVVWVTQASGTNTLVSGLFSSRAELTTTPVVLCGANPTKTVAGTMTGLAAGDQGNISYGNRTATGGLASSAFTLNGVLEGAQDVVGYRQNAATPFVNDRMLLRRDVSVANGGTLGTLDFNGADSFVPATATFTLPNAGTDQIARGMSYLTGSACTTASLYQAAPGTGTTFTMTGVPAARQVATDYHQAFVTAIGTGVNRTVVETFRTLAPRTVTLPAVPANVQVTSLGGPYKRLQTAFTLPAEYSSMGIAYYDAGALHYVTVGSTLAYLGSTAGVVGMPDLSGVNGWNNAWVPAASAAVTTSSYANGSTTNAVCSDNARAVGVQVNGTN